MNREQIEFNKRQINLMEKKIQYFQENKIYINTLINDLEALTGYIKSFDQVWFEKINDLIWDLEVLYACRLDEDRDYFNVKERLLIQETIEKIQTLIEQYKEQYLSDFEDE